MEVKPGYKRTEVGVIPSDWNVQPIAALLERNTRITYGVVQPGENDPRGVVFVRGGDVFEGKIDLQNLRKIPTSVSQQYERTILKGGELLISLVGFPGECAIAPPELAGANIARQVALARFAADANAVPKFVCYFLLSHEGKQLLLKEAFGSAQKVINLRDINQLELPIPRSTKEQRSIATALSDVDDLLGGLARLIAKKRDLKQAAMQQLLTGQTRLPGFNGEWRTKPLGELITHCFSGATPRRNRPDYFKGDIRWITSGELNYNVITDTLEKITTEAVKMTNLAIVPAGTFLMAITGLEAEGTRGACGIVGAPSTTNQSCMAVFPTSELVTQFLFYYYVLRGKSLALQYCQGTKQQSYTAKLVKQLPIEIPPTLAEQTAIAEVLADMDAELAALEQRRAKTRALKQAMMQDLLTGRVRLV